MRNYKRNTKIVYLGACILLYVPEIVKGSIITSKRKKIKYIKGHYYRYDPQQPLKFYLEIMNGNILLNLNIIAVKDSLFKRDQAAKIIERYYQYHRSCILD